MNLNWKFWRERIFENVESIFNNVVTRIEIENWKIWIEIFSHWDTISKLDYRRQINVRSRRGWNYFWNERYRFKVFIEQGIIGRLWTAPIFLRFYNLSFDFALFKIIYFEKILSTLHLDTTLKESFCVMEFGLRISEGFNQKCTKIHIGLLCSGSPDYNVW